MNDGESRRGAVSLVEVADAVARLEKVGKKLTQENVRAEIGRGSYSQIGPLLKKVLAGVVTPKHELEMFPERLQALIAESKVVMDQWVDQTLKARTEQLDEREKHVEERLAKMTIEHEQSARDLDIERKRTQELSQRVTALEKRNGKLQEESTHHAQDASAAKAQLKEMIPRAENAEKEVAALKKARAQFEKDAQRQIQQIKDESESKITALEATVKQLNSECRTLDLKRQETEMLLQQAEAARQLLTLQVQTISGQVETVKENLATVTVELHEAGKQIRDKDAQLSAATAKANERADEISRLNSTFIASQKEQELRHHSEVEALKAEHSGVLINLVEHARKLVQVAQAATVGEDAELSNLVAAQGNIEKLFGDKAKR